MWSRMHAQDWQQMYETLQYQYNPIWNKDGTISETEEESRSGTRTTEGSDGNTRTLNTQSVSQLSGTDTVSESGEENSTTTNSVNAYNSGTGTEHDKSVVGSSWSSERSVTYGKTDTGSDTGTITDSGSRTETAEDSGSSSRSFTRKEYGNIGVTMTQQMVREQRSVIMNFYQYIIGAFKERFCILIW